jgi:hypothetical protein
MDPELAALQQAIQILHQLMVHMSDPQAVATVGKCLQALTGLQQQIMQGQQQQPGVSTQGGPPQGQPQAQSPGANPMVAALAQRLQGAGSPAQY